MRKDLDDSGKVKLEAMLLAGQKEAGRQNVEDLGAWRFIETKRQKLQIRK